MKENVAPFPVEDGTLFGATTQGRINHVVSNRGGTNTASVDIVVQKKDNDEYEKERKNQRATSWSPKTWAACVIKLCLLYCVGLAIVGLLVKRLPSLDNLKKVTGTVSTNATGVINIDTNAQPSRLVLKVPESFDELRAVKQTLLLYKQYYEFDLMLFLSASYVFLETFMIPGPALLNILVGSIYALVPALVYVSAVSTIGTSCNFLMVKYILKDPITALMPKKIAKFKKELASHSKHLFYYMLFIRVTPFLPHWFVSLASPVVGIPFHVFVPASVLGHQPLNFIFIHGGSALSSLNSLQDLYNMENVLFLLACAMIACVPILWRFRKKKRKKVSGDDGSLLLPVHVQQGVPVDSIRRK